MSQDFIVGIDLGTTNSLIGVVDSGFPILLADEEGQRLTPSAVYYPPGGGEPAVGRAALRRRGAEPGRVVTSVKRLIGWRGGEVDLRALPYPAGADAAGEIRVLPGEEGADATPAEVSACILRRLKAVAEARMEAPVRRAVITVPAYFNDAQRKATIRAGELAGLQVERIVNEPTAAALAYGIDRKGDRAKIAVFDLGGGTFDISILELNDGVFQVLATCGDTQLGGDDIDEALAESLWESGPAAAHGPWARCPASARAAFLDAARGAKERLSEYDAAEVRLPFFLGSDSFEAEVRRAEFERLAAPVVARARPHCLQALADAGLAPGDLDEVILVGGSTRLPAVRALAAEIFAREPNLSQNPDEAVALGAAIQGGILSGALRHAVLLDVTPLSLGIETFGGLMNVIIPRNTTIPAKAGELFTNAVANQPAMAIRILQGEREMARDNWELGRLEVPFAPGAKGSARVGVQFEIDANGALTVLCRDTATGEDRVLAIDSAAVDVDDANVEQMISDSVDHAFDDFNERIWTEAKLKAEEMLPAVESALAAIGEELPAGDRAPIEAAAGEVKRALAAGPAEAQRLKSACQALDEATEHLAALIVERAAMAALS